MKNASTTVTIETSVNMTKFHEATIKAYKFNRELLLIKLESAPFYRLLYKYILNKKLDSVETKIADLKKLLN